MKLETVQVFRKSDNKRLGYLFFSKTRDRLAFVINTVGQELRYHAMQTFQTALPQIESRKIFEVVKEGVGRQPVTLAEHRRLLQEKDSLYLKRIAEVLPALEIPEFLSSINDYGNPQPDRIYGAYKVRDIKDAEIKVIKDTLRTNNYDFKQLAGVTVTVSSPIKCPLCANSHNQRFEVKVKRVEDKKAYAGSGSAYIWCSMPYAGGEFRVKWNSVELAIVHTERVDRRDSDYW
jgi:hypothetical protein